MDSSPRTHKSFARAHRREDVVTHASTHACDAVVVTNPVAPKQAEAREALERAATSRSSRVRFLHLGAGENGREALRRELQSACASGCDRVIAVGGDGTASIAADAIVQSRRESDVALAIVPAGTANVLARELGLPTDLDEAARLAIEGEETLDLDALLVGGRPILTQIGIGPDAEMIRHTSRDEQVRLGRLAYLRSLFERAPRQSPHWFELRIDDHRIRVRAWEIVISNVGAAGMPPLTWGPGIDPTDGVIDVSVFDVRQFSDYWNVAWRLVTGSHRRAPNARYYRAKRRVSIRAQESVLAQGDGEVLGRTPLDVGIAPAALRVVVPRDLSGVEGAAGTPAEPPGAGGPTVAEVAPPPGQGETSIGEDVDTMLAEHSRTWVLQGALRHPLSALSALDAALFLRANSLVLGTWPDQALVLLSRFMHFGEGWALVAGILMLADWGTGWRATVTALPALWITMLAVNGPLKALFRRRRPFLAFVKARVIGPRPVDFSLPSGHTAAAFAGALLFGSYTPGWSPLYYVLAVLVGFSRIYLGVHYPSDVLLGALAGTVLAAFCRWGLAAAFPALR